MRLNDIYYLHEIGGKKNQEDYIWPPPGSATLNDKIFMVCDGVGGSENGEVASTIVAESMARLLLKIDLPYITIDIIDNIIKEATQDLAVYVKSNGLNQDMATTFTLLVFLDDKALCVWCGDSRLYHFREGETIFKTFDHSLVNTLVKSGEITEEEARIHPQKNIILKAVKADNSPVEYDYHWIEEIKESDYFLLCTDGLLENIDDNELKELLIVNHRDGDDFIPSFQRFCENKTRDNYSMYLLRATEQPEKKPNNRGRKYLIAGGLLLLIITLTAFLFYNKNKTVPLSAPHSEKFDSPLVNETLTSSPVNPSAPFAGDSGINYEILISDEKLDSLVPQASSTIIQPVEPTKKIKVTLSPARDSVKKNKNRSNDISEPGKKDSSKPAKASN